MKNYFITTKIEKFEIPNPESYTLYTIEKNTYRTWIKINLNILSNGQLIIAYKLGRKWSEKEITEFVTGAAKGEYYVIYLTKNSYNINFIHPIFEDKKSLGRDCYKGSINFVCRTTNTNGMSFRFAYIEESEDKKTT